MTEIEKAAERLCKAAVYLMEESVARFGGNTSIVGEEDLRRLKCAADAYLQAVANTADDAADATEL